MDLNVIMEISSFWLEGGQTNGEKKSEGVKGKEWKRRRGWKGKIGRLLNGKVEIEKGG